MLRRSPLRAKRKTVPVAAKRHWDRVAALGCLVCGGEATIHHVTGFADKPGRLRRDDWQVVPLCRVHHQKVWDPRASDPVSVEGLSHQGFYQKHGIDLLAVAMRLADETRDA